MRGSLLVKMIVGLGNPGREYGATRHNLGFMVVDEVARCTQATAHRSRFRAELAEAIADGQKIILLKPQTYMNLSGISVREAVRWYKIAAEDVLIVADDIDLPFGAQRMRASGGSGGHNGLKSIIEELGTEAVPRLRLGVGRGAGHAIRQVLTRFNKQEELELPEIISAAAECALAWQRDGIVTAMNRCNRRPDAASPSAMTLESPGV
jgi:PTH1 family peptidyl-tRNA hydrolase